MNLYYNRRVLVIATTNRHKFIEIEQILAGLPITLVPLDKQTEIKAPEETGLTFADNAKLKATYYSSNSRFLTVADDSGLEIDALDGEPGVLSARFNGESYPEKFEEIYRQLRERNVTGSSARFVCSIALAEYKHVIFKTTRTIEGRITLTPRGQNGFGYDPIFFYPPHTKTLAELSPKSKAAVSHRGQAFRALRCFLENHLISQAR